MSLLDVLSSLRVGQGKWGLLLFVVLASQKEVVAARRVGREEETETLSFL